MIVATWGVHLRIAEKILKIHMDLDTKNFLVGNIGPDCGLPIDDRGQFNPPREVTHWFDEKGKIRPDFFKDKYLSPISSNNKKRSFLIGYYVHLLTDIEWIKMYEKLKNTNKDYAKLKKYPNLIWTIKKDWYDLDHLYFRNHPNSIFFTSFQYIDTIENYLSYYPDNAIIIQVKHITKFYNNPSRNLDRNYIYLSLQTMHEFIEKTLIVINTKLNELFYLD